MVEVDFRAADKEGLGLRIATLNGLTIDEAAKIQRESKWPLEAIKALNSTAEYNIYKDASLVPTQMTDGSWTFLNANSQKKFAEFHYRAPVPGTNLFSKTC